MRESVRDIQSSVLLILVGIAVFVYSFQVRVVIPGDIGSGFFPRMLSVILVFSSAVQLCKGLRQYAMEKGTPHETQSVNVRCVLESIVCIGIFIALLDYLGFFISAFIYLLAQFAALAPINKKILFRIVILSIVVPIVVYAVFVHGFSMILPHFNAF
jgi:hypothetical protein